MRRQLCVHSWLHRLCHRCWRTAALAIAATCAAARYAGLRCSGAPSHSSCCAWLLDANYFTAVCVYCCCSNSARLLCGRASHSDRPCRSRRRGTQASRLVQRLLQAAVHAKYALLVEGRPRYNARAHRVRSYLPAAVSRLVMLGSHKREPRAFVRRPLCVYAYAARRVQARSTCRRFVRRPAHTVYRASCVHGTSPRRSSLVPSSVQQAKHEQQHRKNRIGRCATSNNTGRQEHAKTYCVQRTTTVRSAATIFPTLSR